MTRQELLDYKSRWVEVNRFQIEEMRARPVAERLRGFAFMLQTGRAWPWTARQLEVEEAGIGQVRARWAKVRKAHGV